MTRHDKKTRKDKRKHNKTRIEREGTFIYSKNIFVQRKKEDRPTEKETRKTGQKEQDKRKNRYKEKKKTASNTERQGKTKGRQV